MSSRKRERQGV